MIDTKQLVQLVRDAEKTANSPEHLRELLHASGVLVEFRRDGDGKVNGWTLRPADSGETDWLKGSELTADRSFSWSKLAARRGWLADAPTPKAPLPTDILAVEEAEEEVEETREERQVKNALAMLIDVCSEMSIRLFEVLLKFINKLMAALGLRMRLELPDRAERVSQARIRTLPPTPKPAAPNYGEALKTIQTMTTSVAQNDSAGMGRLFSRSGESLVPLVPINDQRAVADFLDGRKARVGRPVDAHKPPLKSVPTDVQTQTPAERIARLEVRRTAIFDERRPLIFELNFGLTMRKPASVLNNLKERISALTTLHESLTRQIHEEERAQMTPEELHQAEEVAAEKVRQQMIQQRKEEG
jgi:hypothetical protein